ncbi:putative defense protein 3 [Liolophura sinensis]|uniref:putative defense protein 3 n=1 Tax=Liolophura sinensis TaxID=3198878 RepID=UPI00315915DC
MASYFSSVALLVLLAAVLPCVHAFPSGAPATACESLTPGHRGQLPQTSAPPFAVRLEKNTYSPNEQIAVTLYSACNNEIFQGFMVQVRAVGSTAPVGFFTNAPQTRNVPGCGSFNQAMTHTGSSEKTEVALQWIAPDQSVGDVVVFATFLRNYQTFWVMVASAVIRDASRPSGGPSVSSEYPTRTVCQTAIPPPQPTRPPTRTTTTTTATTTTTTTTTTPAPTPRRIFTPPLPPVTTVRPQKEGTTTLPTVSKEANFPGNRTVQSSTVSVLSQRPVILIVCCVIFSFGTLS